MGKRHPLTIVFARGAARSIEAVVRRNGSCPALDFFNALEGIREGSKNKPESTAKHKFAVLFQQMANYGTVSPKRFKPKMGKLFAFQHEVRNVQIRFPCFADGQNWILTHGFVKPGAKKKLGAWPQGEVDKANELMVEYWERKKEEGSK